MQSVFISSFLTFTLSLSLAIPNPSIFESNKLAPRSKIPFVKGGLNWLTFASSGSASFYRVPDKIKIKEEIHDLGVSLVLDESGEDRMTVDDLPEADLSSIEGELFVLSDVHLAPRDLAGLPEWKYTQLLAFLDKVAVEGGTLILNGDIVEGHMPKTLLVKKLKEVYAKLRKIKRVFYLAGNHDAEFEVLEGKRWKNISFVNSLSIRQNGKIIHIEHGHYTDWWWHHIGENLPLYKKPFMAFGKFIIWGVNKLGSEHNVDISVGWIKWANWIKLVLFVPLFVQLLLMDVRIRYLRKEMKLTEISDVYGVFAERIIKPFWWIYNLRRLWREVKTPKPDETVLKFVIGHYHYGDMLFMSQFQKILEATESRVKIYFTAGRWVTIPVPMRLKFTRIDSNGEVSTENLNDFLEDKDLSQPSYRETRRHKALGQLMVLTELLPRQTSLGASM